MTEHPQGGTLGGVLAARRRQGFVGRRAELELFAAALAGDDPSFALLFVHGPGGVGKSSLLDELAARAREATATVVRVDGRAMPATVDAFEEALAPALDARRSASAPSAPRLVVLVDAFERLLPLEGWLHDDLMARLPSSTIVVVASRAPPGAAWRSDPAWRDLLRVVALRNLSPGDSRTLLRRAGIDPVHHDAIVARSHGHPLALALLADGVARGGGAGIDPLDADIVGALLRRFVDAVPSARHRRALEACALARVTTVGLLREAVDADEPDALFEWLRGLPFVDAVRDGLAPHDLARDVLDVDLRWRDPDTYRQVFRDVRAHVHRRLHELTGAAQQQAIFDEKFVFRNLPSVLSPVDWEVWGDRLPLPATPAQRDEVIALIARQHGPRSASIAAAWAACQPESFAVILDDDGSVRGGIVLVTVDWAGARRDPGAAAAWSFAQRHAPPRPGEVITQTRFIVDRAPQVQSPTMNATPVITIQRYLQTPNLAWDFLTLADPDPFDPYFAIADLPRAVGADFVVDGRRYGLFAHDLRRVPVDAWLEVITERALAQGAAAAPATTGELLVLSREDFDVAVREALRQLRRSDLLDQSPLRRTRVVAERGPTGTPSGKDVAAAITAAAELLRAERRDDKRWRALERTYLRPAPTQEQAAELLGIPFSTYRRHLTEGVARLADILWERELYGWPT